MTRGRQLAALVVTLVAGAAAMLAVRSRRDGGLLDEPGAVAPDGGPATAPGPVGERPSATPDAPTRDTELDAAPASAGGLGAGDAVVRVVDETGAPLAGVEIECFRMPGTGRPAPRDGTDARDAVVTVTTDADGLARRQGPRDALCFFRPLSSSEGWCAARVGGETATLRWTKTTRARVHVVTATGAPVRGARVVFAAGRERTPEEMEGTSRTYATDDGPGDVLVSTTTGEDGVAVIQAPLAAPRGRLRVTPPYASLVPVARDTWAPADTEVVLAPALRVAGVVRTPAGEALGDGEVLWRAADGREGTVRVEYDGTFEVVGVPAGPVALALHLDDVPGTEDRVRATVAAGTEDAVLVAALGAGLVVRVAGWPREPGGAAFLTPEDGGGGPPIRAEVDLEGTARFVGLDPSRAYRLHVPAGDVRGLASETDAGPVHRGVDRGGLKAGEEPVEVTLAPLRTVAFTVQLPGPVALPSRPGVRVFAWHVEVRVAQPGAAATGGRWVEVARDASPAMTLVAPVAGVVAGALRYRVLVTADLLLENGDDAQVYATGEGTFAADATAVEVSLRAIELTGAQRDAFWTPPTGR